MAKESSISDRYKQLSCISALFTFLCGMLVLLSLSSGVNFLESFYLNGIAVKGNTGVGLLLSGLAVILSLQKSRKWIRTILPLIIFAILALGILTLGEHLIGLNFGIDQLLFSESPGALATMSPGRMGPPACVSFVIAGAALLLMLRAEPVFRDASARLGICLGAVTLLPILGHLYGAHELYGLAQFTAIAFPTAIAFFFLGLSLVFASDGGHIHGLLQAPDAGGMLLRRLLPAVIIFPPIL